MPRQLGAKAIVLHRLPPHCGDEIYHLGKLPLCHPCGDVKEIILGHQPRRLADGAHRHLRAVGPAEVQKGQGVPHPAVGQPPDKLRCLRLQQKAFLPRHIGEAAGDGRAGDAAKIEPLAPGDDSGEHLLNLGGGQDKDDMLRRLLQHLKEGVHRPLGEHMGLIHDVNPVFGDIGEEVGLLPQVPDAVHPVVAGGVNLHHIQNVLAVNTPADFTRPAGVPVLWGKAVHRLCNKPGAAGLAGAPATHQQIGVGGAALANLVFQGGGDRLLPHHILKALGPPLAVKGLIHGGAPPPYNRLPKKDRHPLPQLGGGREYPLPCGNRLAAAPAGHRLMLLGSPPDMVHDAASHRAGSPHGTKHSPACLSFGWLGSRPLPQTGSSLLYTVPPENSRLFFGR